MAQQVTMWEADDGTCHRSRSEAEAHETKGRLIWDLACWLANGTPTEETISRATALVRDWNISRKAPLE